MRVHVCLQNLASIETMEHALSTSKGPQFYPRHFAALETSVSLTVLDMAMVYFFS